MPPISVFISHNKADKEIAQNIGIFLAAENINVWFDKWEISAGDSIIREINRGLADCTHFLILWSSNAATLRWVTVELESVLSNAIETENPRIIPIILDNTSLPSLLKSLRYIRYAGGTEEDRTNIIKAVSGHNPSNDFIRAIVEKYHEVIIDHNIAGPFPYKACPQCGSTRLKGSCALDEKHDDMYYFIECEECKWNEWMG